jgi:hypothetical protein
MHLARRVAQVAEIDPAAAGAAVASMTVVDAWQGIDTAAWCGCGWRVLSLTATSLGVPTTHHTRRVQDGSEDALDKLSLQMATSVTRHPH